MTVTLITCIAAIPSRFGRRASASMTQFENAKNAPPTSAQTTAVAP